MSAVLAVGGSDREVGSVINDYDNVEMVYQSDSEFADMSVPEFFNQVIENFEGQVFGFLRPCDNFANPNVLERTIQVLAENRFFGSCYSDNILKDNGTIIYHPSYDVRLPKSKILVNTSLFIKSDVITQTRFDTRFTTLYMYDIIIRLAAMSFMVHIPEPLICSELENVNISEDLKLINGA